MKRRRFLKTLGGSAVTTTALAAASDPSTATQTPLSVERSLTETTSVSNDRKLDGDCTANIYDAGLSIGLTLHYGGLYTNNGEGNKDYKHTFYIFGMGQSFAEWFEPGGGGNPTPKSNVCDTRREAEGLIAGHSLSIDNDGGELWTPRQMGDELGAVPSPNTTTTRRLAVDNITREVVETGARSIAGSIPVLSTLEEAYSIYEQAQSVQLYDTESGSVPEPPGASFPWAYKGDEGENANVDWADADRLYDYPAGFVHFAAFEVKVDAGEQLNGVTVRNRMKMAEGTMPRDFSTEPGNRIRMTGFSTPDDPGCPDLNETARRFDANDNCSISTEELNTAVDAWSRGDISSEALNEVVEAWAASS